MRGSTPSIGTTGLSGRAAGVGLGCGELGTMGLIDSGGCCEACHSADGFAIDGAAALGPCHTVLADGRAALVCCAARKHLGGR
jgi:hypothetical protein